MSDTAVYIHIPYCKSKCGYCDFCSSTDASTADAYTDELIRRIKLCEPGNAASFYSGGGTPTYIGAERLIRVLDALSSRFHLSSDCEISTECNPGTADEGELRKLRLAGFNRISAGIQTAVPEELAALGRTSHTVDDGKKLFVSARRAGFDNINLDLMYGIPGQSMESLERSLSFVTDLGPEHVSAYALRLEEGTPLYGARPRLPDDDTVADMYGRINETLSGNGYKRYEISNFAVPGRECRHNLRYWKGGDYIGFGVSAASLVGNTRYLQPPGMDAFLSGAEPDPVETLDRAGAEAEYVMLRLRLTEGIDKSDFKNKFDAVFDEKYGKRIKKYVDGGFAVNTDERFYLTDKGVFVSNTVIADLIYD